MRIITTYNNTFHCEWYHCTINDHKFSSPIREDVEAWRDEKLNNSDYYRELSELRTEGLASMYTNNHNNYTGD